MEQRALLVAGLLGLGLVIATIVLSPADAPADAPDPTANPVVTEARLVPRQTRAIGPIQRALRASQAEQDAENPDGEPGDALDRQPADGTEE